MQSLWLMLPLFFILLILIPINIEIRVVFNPLKNHGVFVMKILFIRIKFAFFKFKGKSLIMRTKKGAKQKELVVSQEDLRIFEQYSLQLKDKMKVKKVEFHSHIGVRDAFQSALLSGLVCSIANMAMGYVKNLKQTSEVRVVGHTSYNLKRFQLGLLVRMSISIYDIMYCFVMASLITRKIDKYGYRSEL